MFADRGRCPEPPGRYHFSGSGDEPGGRRSHRERRRSPPALQRTLAQVKNGEPALVDTVTQHDAKILLSKTRRSRQCRLSSSADSPLEGDGFELPVPREDWSGCESGISSHSATEDRRHPVRRAPRRPGLDRLARKVMNRGNRRERDLWRGNQHHRAKSVGRETSLCR